MKPFHEWVMEPVAPEQPDTDDYAMDNRSPHIPAGFENVHPDLVEYNLDAGLDFKSKGAWCYPCNSCGDLIRIEEYMDLQDFDPNLSYCGKGPFCIP